ncbi:MAG TPA: alpha,alpha-trehalase TreA [Chitinophagaceae bacterium]
MQRLFFFLFVIFSTHTLSAQKILPPDQVYGELFKDVQLSRIFPDSKTFADAVPKKDPEEIVKQYQQMKANPAIRFSLRMFVEENFELPKPPQLNYVQKEKDVTMHIKNLWGVLQRQPDKQVEGSSLLALPYPYIVPGGRFGEIYYWDSYFTMLGLKESGENEMIENMVNNFSYLISTYGHIPNGNRSYYLSRSQPPFFSVMIELLSKIKGDFVYATYQPVLQKEYDYWMDKTPGSSHVIKMQDGSVLNRYYDESASPRQEAYVEDIQVAEKSKRDKDIVLRNLRSTAESGWDFSSRWFTDGKSLSTIQTIDVIPVDLNSLLYHLEKSLALANRISGNLIQERYFNQLADRRRKSMNKYLWSTANGWYMDYDFKTKKITPEKTLAGMSPFFFHIADQSKMSVVKRTLQKNFVKAGGVVTTLKNTGEQWDAPNGWAPLQWITIIGLENYGQHELAKDIADRWVKLNIKVYENTGKLLEKYNVEDMHLTAGGGEYPTQDGFGWTNGVLLALMNKFNLK